MSVQDPQPMDIAPSPSNGGNSSDSSTTNYANVTYRKVTGSLVLDKDKCIFQPSSNAANSFGVRWNQIAKHQVSPASHSKAMLKLVHFDGKSSTFIFQNREELERIRKDISGRLQEARLRTSSSSPPSHASPSQSPFPMRLSGKKRSHSQSAAMMAKAAIGKTTSTSFGELDPTAVAVTRSSLLAANPSLRSQHQYLVEETKTLSEDDFWKTHQDLLEEEYARISGMTRAGTSSLLQSHLQLASGRVKLGVEEMRQIFIMYPAVHKAYEEKVPLELSDEQFWRKYLESEYFHRDRGKHGAASRQQQSQKQAKAAAEQEARAAAVSSDDIFSRYDQKLKEGGVIDNETTLRGKKWGSHLANGQFDLAATFETERGNLLEGPKDNHPYPEDDDGKGARVIQKYNRHWAMVLHSEDAKAGSNLVQVARKSLSEVMPDDEDAKPGGGEMQDMYQLVEFAEASSSGANHALGKNVEKSNDYEALSLSNIEVYHSSQPSSGAEALLDTEESKKKRIFFANSIASKMATLASSFDVKTSSDDEAHALRNAFPPPNLGRELLMALTKKMAQDAKTDSDTLSIVDKFPEDFKKRLHSYFRRSSELLRHFFGLRRLVEGQGGHPSHNQKLKKIVEGMESVYREMEGMRKEIGSNQVGELMQTMQKMCLQIMDQLDIAFRLHREGSGNGSGGSGFVTIEEF